MHTSYLITIALVFLAGIGHCVMTFKRFKNLEENALWFFSAGLGIVTLTFLNYINLKENTSATSALTIAGNLLFAIFMLLLARIVPRKQMLILAFLGVVLLGLSLFNAYGND